MKIGAASPGRAIAEGYEVNLHVLSEISAAFAPLPGMQPFLLGVSAAVWLVGGNVLVAFHYRRMGKSIWSGFRLSAFPFKDFNQGEWLVLAILACISLSFGRMAIS